MKRKTKRIMAPIVLILAGFAVALYLHRVETADSTIGRPKHTPVQSTQQKKMDRLARLAQLKKVHRGRLPVDQGLAGAATTEQRSRINREFAYQRETREQAASRARTRLADITNLLHNEKDPMQRQIIERQITVLESLLNRLEQSQ